MLKGDRMRAVEGDKYKVSVRQEMRHVSTKELFTSSRSVNSKFLEFAGRVEIQRFDIF
jgi:hypothetical protein